MYWLSSTSTALVTAAAREKGLLGRMTQQWRVVGIRLGGGGGNLNNEFTVYMLWLRLVVDNVVLSLQPGGGDALTRGLNEVHRKINGGAVHTKAKWLS